MIKAHNVPSLSPFLPSYHFRSCLCSADLTAHIYREWVNTRCIRPGLHFQSTAPSSNFMRFDNEIGFLPVIVLER